MIPITIDLSHDNIFQGVKMEASLLAERIRNEQGETMFEEFVFDEEYLIGFRQYFYEAQAELIPVFAAYMKNLPDWSTYFEGKDFSRNRDFKIRLSMPEDFLTPLAVAIEIKTKEYIIAYIMYRWLETKMPQYAAIYQARADKLREFIKSNLDKGKYPRRRKHGMF